MTSTCIECLKLNCLFENINTIIYQHDPDLQTDVKHPLDHLSLKHKAGTNLVASLV